MCYVNNNLSNNYDKKPDSIGAIADCNSPGANFTVYNESTKNSPYTSGLTYSTEGILITSFPNRNEWNSQLALSNNTAPRPYIRGLGNDHNWTDWSVIALKSDLIGRSIYIAADGGTQNFNSGNNGFLFIPYTSTTFGIYYIGRDSAKLILGTEDSDFKVSISGNTCTLQNNKGWNIFCVFIAGQ